jgi:hypothetical protein
MKNTSLLCPWTRRHREVKKASRVVPPAVPTNTPSTVAKIVTTDHASTLFEMQRRLVPQGRTQRFIGLHRQPRVPSSHHPQAPLKHPSFALHDGHHQMFTCPDTRRLEAPLLVCFVPSGTGAVPHTKRYNTAPVAPEMRASTKTSLTVRFFYGRWTLADPTTAAEPGIRAPERPKKSTGNLTPPNMIRAMAPALCPPMTPVNLGDIYGNTWVWQSDPRSSKPTIRDGLAVIRGGATRGMNARSFNSMSRLIQDRTALGRLHALIIERVFAVLSGIRDVSFQKEQMLRASGRSLATTLPSSLLLGVEQTLLDGSPEGEFGDGVAVSSHWRIYFRLQFPCIIETAPCTPLQVCPSACDFVQVPAEAGLSAAVGIAAASHPILQQRYLLR